MLQFPRSQIFTKFADKFKNFVKNKNNKKIGKI